MAYQPIRNPNVQPARLDNIELDTRYDPAAPSENSSNDDKKPFFRSHSEANRETPAPGSSWPVAAQRVAGLTPLRAGLLVFDTILASTPIMFVGESFFQSAIGMGAIASWWRLGLNFFYSTVLVDTS
jgi:hypothetical protein